MIFKDDRKCMDAFYIYIYKRSQIVLSEPFLLLIFIFHWGALHFEIYIGSRDQLIPNQRSWDKYQN